MKSAAIAGIVLTLATPGLATAHQLDEYVQATRLSLTDDRVLLEIDLVPGKAIAPDVLTRLDRDSDNTISPSEAVAYGRLVIGDVILTLDGRPIVISPVHVEVTPIDALREGVGAIQIRAAGDFASRVRGRRQMYFRNNHLPDVSVYLVNALLPDDRNIRVIGQTRNTTQQEVRIDYDVGPRWAAQVLWLAFGTTGLLTLVMVRTRRPSPVNAALAFRSRDAQWSGVTIP